MLPVSLPCIALGSGVLGVSLRLDPPSIYPRRMTEPPEITIEKQDAPTLTPSEAAKRVGIKGAMLRRYASTYEDVFEPLPRDERGSRRFSVDVVQRFLTVRDLLRSNAVTSTREGFEQLRDGTPDASIAVPLSAQGEMLQRLSEEVGAALRSSNMHLVSLEHETKQLREEVEQLRKEIEEARTRRGFFARLFGR